MLDSLTYQGREFRVYIESDSDHGRPWDESDGHGPVREVSRNYTGRLQKTPGERILHNGDRNEYSFAYDWQAAMRLARADGWGVAGGKRAFETRGQYAARAVQADFDYLRRWCSGYWEYVGVCVVLLDSHGGEIGDKFDHALWGVESDSADYLREVAQELAGQILSERAQSWRAALSEARARRYWAQRDVQTVGV